MPARPANPGRRHLVTGLAAAAFCLTGRVALAQPAVPVYVISRQRLLTESAPTRVLREAEAGMTAILQREIDEAKARLAAEEVELTRLRDQLSPAEMADRAGDFDRRVRLTRRLAKDRAAAVQGAFQEARAALVAALPAVLEELRLEVGAVAILDADQTLAIDPAHDLTDRAIALFNAKAPPPRLPRIDLRLVIPDPARDGDTPAPQGDRPGTDR